MISNTKVPSIKGDLASKFNVNAFIEFENKYTPRERRKYFAIYRSVDERSHKRQFRKEYEKYLLMKRDPYSFFEEQKYRTESSCEDFNSLMSISRYTRPEFAEFHAINMVVRTPVLRKELRDICIEHGLLHQYHELMRNPAFMMHTESGQGDPTLTEGKVTTTHDNENIKDVGGTDHEITVAGTSRYLNNGQEVICDISNFLHRPIQIDEVTIASGQLSSEYKIFDLLSTDPAIRSKFRNFAYFKGDVEITIALSGTPFHMGKVLVAYYPYPTANKTLQVLLQRLTVDPTVYRPLILNYLSQSHGARIIDVKMNDPVHFKIPFISPKPMWRLFNASSPPLTAATAYEDFEDSGSLFIYTINDISSVAATPTDISMTVYANFVDVKLGTLTSSGTDIATESSNENPLDEQKVGPVQKVISSLASVTSKLSAIPEIAPFAIPSTIALKGMSELAAYFGWAKPILVENRSTMKPDGFTNGMVTIGNDTAKTLGVDPKRQLIVDQCMFGDNKDELSLEFISRDTSYVNTFTWLATSVPFVPLQYYAVMPGMETRVEPLVNIHYIQPTALAFASYPFTFWRGDIVFTIEVVASAYHRGKLAISYDPNVFNSTTVSSSPTLNKQYTYILDIQEAQTISVCIKWAHFRAWCETRRTGGSPFLPYSTSGAFFGELVDYANGFIWIYPLTYLQSPLSSQGVSINMYVHGENMHYALPSANNIPPSRATYTESLHGFDPTCEILNPSSASDEEIHAQHFGEKITSFRQLLKRYSLSDSASTGPSSLNYASTLVPIYPVIQNKYGTGEVTTNILSYLRYSYLGMRGSMRHRIKFSLYEDNNTTKHVNVALSPPGVFVSDTMTIATSNTYSPLGYDGGVTFLPEVNPGVEIDAPFYSNNLWLFAMQDNWEQPSSNSSQFQKNFTRSFLVSYDQSEGTSSSENHLVLDETATGEDFNLYRFSGASPYYEASV